MNEEINKQLDEIKYEYINNLINTDTLKAFQKMAAIIPNDLSIPDLLNHMRKLDKAKDILNNSIIAMKKLQEQLDLMLEDREYLVLIESLKIEIEKYINYYTNKKTIIEEAYFYSNANMNVREFNSIDKYTVDLSNLNNIKIINKIEQKVKEYQARTGVTQQWMANRLEVSKQSFNSLFKSENITLKKLIQLSILLNCDIKDLYDYTI
jgi:DNA-binding XRE family transcriptional regulator